MRNSSSLIARSLIVALKRLRSGFLLGTHQQKLRLQMFQGTNDRPARHRCFGVWGIYSGPRGNCGQLAESFARTAPEYKTKIYMRGCLKGIPQRLSVVCNFSRRPRSHPSRFVSFAGSKEITFASFGDTKEDGTES